MTMRRPAGFTTRRHRPSAAAIAYAHALTIVQNPLVAESIASAALRRGAHSRLAVIAHARHQALEHARRTPPADVDEIAGPDLRTLAVQLANTRPAIERAIVDLELRYGLDPSSFARVLGLTIRRATERSMTVTQSWNTALDPSVMAWLGPGACDEFATILTSARLWPRAADTPVVSSIDTTGPIPVVSGDTTVNSTLEQTTAISTVTVRALLDVAPTVREHADSCNTCGERLKMLTSIRSMHGQASIQNVPASVAESAKTAYRRIPTPLPPSIEPHRVDISRFRIPVFTVSALTVVVLFGAFIASRDSDNKPTQADRVAKLLDSPTPSNLLATPSVVTSNTKTASLANTSEKPLTWKAEASVPWIAITPRNGNLAPTQSVSLGLQSTEPTNNHTDAQVTITGSDGSLQVLQYSAAH